MKKLFINILRALLFASSMLVLNSCHIFISSKYDSANNFTDFPLQPGHKLAIFLNDNPVHTVSSTSIKSTLSLANVKFKDLHEIAESHATLLTLVTKNLSKDATPQHLAKQIENLSDKNLQEKKRHFHVLSKLYPLYTYQIGAALIDINLDNRELVLSYLRKHKFDASYALPKNQQQDVTIVPLINSLSMTIPASFISEQQSKVRVEIAESTTQEIKLIPLYYEPVLNAYSGSIFDLRAATEYKITIDKNIKFSFFDTSKETFLVKTRPNKPPIDPNNQHYLADFYKGGQLDIRSLGIKGKPGSWAKVDGRNVTIRSDEQAALLIGDSSYIYFENIQIEGGARHAVSANGAHHLWFNSCNISKWGRVAKDMRGGIGFANKSSERPINYDAGFALARTGVVVIENCDVHSPNGSANSWTFGHPMGPTAIFVNADHANNQYDGQYIVRNNRFYGSYGKRFNDVIEGKSNGRVWGGFVRDSVIHNNYLAFANDDAIEIDGGQHNVAVYRNKISNTYVGISAVPNMRGPSFIFENTIENLGDQRGKRFTHLKLGGLFARPSGIVVYQPSSDANKLKRKHAAVGFAGDKNYWLHTLE